MRRHGVVVGLVSAVVLALVPGSAKADTVDPAPVRSFTAHQGWGVGVSPKTGLIYAPDDAGLVHVYAPTAAGASPAELFNFAEPPGNNCIAAPSFNRPGTPAFDPVGANLAINCVGEVALYALDANGGAVYRGAISGFTGLTSSVFDGQGHLVVVSRGSTAVSIYDVSTFAPAPVPSISVAGLVEPRGLALSGSTLYVVDGGAAKVFAVDYPGGSPVRTLTVGSGLISLQSVQVDSAGHVYVSAFDGGVAVYASDASGAAAPLKVLTGPTSGLTGGLTSMVIDAKRNIYVSQLNTPGKYFTFAPLFALPAPPPPAAVAPGAVTKLVVAGKKTDKKRTVTWAAGSAGSSPITSYAVVVTKGTKKLFSTTTAGTSVKLKAKKLRSGKLTVTVTPTSSVGSGPAASTTFKVKLPKKKPR